MSSKVDRAAHGPSWGEVILGAILSLLLGVVLGAALLIFKPVVMAKEMPPAKDRQPGAVYYVEGLRGDASRAKQALAKRKALMEGQSIKVTEDEVNSLVSASAAPTVAAKPGEAPAAPASETVSTGTPNVRIREGVMQVGVPVTLNVLGLEQKLIAQARGAFEKDGDRFVYVPREMYLGSCPVHRLPFLAGYVRGKLLSSEQVPDDIAAAWSRFTTVAIEGNALVLAAQ